MKLEHMIGLIVVLLVILLIIVNLSKEGFLTNEEQHDDHTLKMQKKYNRVGVALAATKTNGTSNIGGLGTDSRSLFGSVQDTVDEANNATQYVDDPFPLEKGISGMALTIGKCEAVKTANDCSAFDNPEFGATCGLCMADASDMGTNSEGLPWIGGLVLTAKEREQYRQENKDRGGNFLAAYNPTVGSCPAGRLVTTKAECKRLKDELDCQRSGAFGAPPHCSQCFSDSSYHIVDPDQPGIIIGAGTLVMVGSGILTVTHGSDTEGPIFLATQPYSLTLLGSEYDPITLYLEKAPVAKPYDPKKVYRRHDVIKYRGKVYEMVEAAGNDPNDSRFAGYDPDREGDRLWNMILDDERKYVPPPNPYIAGYIESPNGSEFKGLDLYRIILRDRLTGRKPRVVQQLTVNEVDVSKMGTGFGQIKMMLDAKSPFTFVDTYSQEASLCPNSPFITNKLSATLLDSDPCYKKGYNTPGKYNLECLQQIFINNGCGTASGTLDRSGYPSTAAKAAALMTDKSGKNLTVDEIANKVYQAAISTATGLDADGNSFPTLNEWSDVSKFCTGVVINSPCDALDESGQVTNDCISYLWDNKGENKMSGIAAGPTYTLASFARSLFSPSISDPPGKINRFCTRAGTRAPKDINNKVNAENMYYWKNQGSGSVADIKKAMRELHLNANNSLTSEDNRTKVPNNYIQQCYGINPSERPLFNSKFEADMSVQEAASGGGPCAVIYQHCTNDPAQRGAEYELCVGNHDMNSPAKDRLSDASYIKVPDGIKATIWTGNFTGTSKVIGPNSEFNFCSDGGWANDSIRSIRIESVSSASSATSVTKTNGNAQWRDFACSSNGSIVMGVEFGNFYFSKDKGESWTPTSSPLGANTSYCSVSCSGDASKIIVATYGGPVYLSTNSGNSWTTISTAGMSGYGTVRCSPNGSTMYAVFQGAGVFVSTNSGSSWTSTSLSTIGLAWVSVACSSDGTTAVVVSYNGGVYTTSTSGESWTKTPIPSTSMWYSATCSTDGSKMAVASQHGMIYVYSGGAWKMSSAKPESGWNGFMSLVGSGNGKLLLATSWPGGVTVSSDAGETWTSSSDVPMINGYAVMSSDGALVILGDFNGRSVYRYKLPPPPPPEKVAATSSAGGRSGVGWSL